jgi:hypothetical protein
MAVLNWFNRVLVAVLLLGILLVGLFLAVAGPGALAAQLRLVATWLDVADALSRLVGLAAGLVAFGLLYLELRLRRPGAIALAGESGASLSTATVVERLRGDVEEVMDVVRARPVVTARRGQVDVQLAVDTSPEVDVPAKAAEIRQVAAGTVERLGLKLGRLNVSISHSGRSLSAGEPPAGSPGSPLGG